MGFPVPGNDIHSTPARETKTAREKKNKKTKHLKEASAQFFLYLNPQYTKAKILFDQYCVELTTLPQYQAHCYHVKAMKHLHSEKKIV